ncbi:hypothetical protein JIN85_04400 [Luteolibacter pohnpeiensis]|uniref:Uncharacterized protein n=1 Tax=Luteolibacter pohnpeiensis TaxID=454153 RepID=A0A934S5I5_9BACT|nr:hypothetical protein [Luteolibacter pohnpeiensis]MBK1881640.1 hypothetical protein [Luteolibacter pohnpeiensis]
MSDLNPYAAPQVVDDAAFSANPNFADLDDKALKKLYHRSSNVNFIAGLIMLAIVFLVAIIPTLSNSGGYEWWMTAIFCVVLVLYVVTAVGLVKRTNWGRTLGIIVSALSLINIPIGTIIGIAGLAAFISSPNLFGAGRVTHRELKAEFKERKRMKKLRAKQG